MKRPTWLLNRAVLAAHRRQLAEHGGASGFDLVRLALALGWPKTVLAFTDAQVTLYDLAAAYSEALLRLLADPRPAALPAAEAVPPPAKAK